jgi:hypothetical protein
MTPLIKAAALPVPQWFPSPFSSPIPSPKLQLEASAMIATRPNPAPLHMGLIMRFLHSYCDSHSLSIIVHSFTSFDPAPFQPAS